MLCFTTKKYTLIAQLATAGVNLYWTDNFAFIDKLRRSRRTRLVPVFAKNAVCGPGGAKLVKSLILRYENSKYIQIFLSELNEPEGQ